MELAAVYAKKCVMVERCRAAGAELAAAREQLAGAREELRRVQRCGCRHQVAWSTSGVPHIRQVMLPRDDALPASP